MTYWIDTLRCEETFHIFKRDEGGKLQAYHVSTGMAEDEVCKAIEYNFSNEEDE